MSKKTNKTVKPETAETVTPESVNTAGGDYLPTVHTPLVSAPEKNTPGQGAPEISTQGQGSDQPVTPPFAAMGIDPAAVLNFALRDGFWVVVTADGQKHLWPADV